MKKTRAQLFVIEVVVAVTVLILLLSGLFSIQTISPPSKNTTNLNNKINVTIDALKESHALYDYFDAAYDKFLRGTFLPSWNATEVLIKQAFIGSLPNTAGFTINLYYFNGSTSVLIDKVNEVPIPSNVGVTDVEYFSPSHYSRTGGLVQNAYRFQVFAWYEVAG